MVEVILTILLITTCYIVITRGLVNVLNMDRRAEEISRIQLDCRNQFYSSRYFAPTNYIVTIAGTGTSNSYKTVMTREAVHQTVYKGPVYATNP